MRIVTPDDQIGILTFHPQKPNAAKSKRHEDRDVGVINSRVIGPTINSDNLLPRKEGLRAGSLLFRSGESILRADFNDTELWDVNLETGVARTSEPFDGPFWTDRWSIYAIRNQHSDEIFRFDGRASSS
jgi:hypothetical protein